jgi:hypothetical protein
MGQGLIVLSTRVMGHLFLELGLLLFFFFLIYDLAFVDMVLTLDVDMNADTSNKTHTTYDNPLTLTVK